MRLRGSMLCQRELKVEPTPMMIVIAAFTGLCLYMFCRLLVLVVCAFPFVHRAQDVICTVDLG